MKQNPVFKKILYATNLGEKMRPVFRMAVNLARVHDAKITMFHTVAPIGTTGQTVLSLYLPEEQIDNLEQDSLEQVIATMQKRLASFCANEDDICNGEDSLVTDTVVLSGNPGETIIRYAAENTIDLIVIGSHTRTPDTHIGIGSTARYITLHSTVPVMVIPNF